jgi:CubicO group peptidase (beta-lactamase class C family)
MINLQSILEAGVADGRAPGFAVSVITREGARAQACAGVRGLDNPVAVTPDTLFWIASCTKAITSVAALQLVERGLLDLDEPVGGRLPILAAPRVLIGFDEAGAPKTRPATTPITLRHLLTHTSGLAYDFDCEDLGRYLSATGEALMGASDPDIPLMFEPGQGWLYGVGIDWTGRLVEAASGQSLDTYMAEHIFSPLGMSDTTFFPDHGQIARKASIHQKLEDGTFVAIPFAMPTARHFMMGGGGLYSTTDDYLTFLATILAGGAPLLKAETFALMMQNQVGEFDSGALKSNQPMLSNDFEPLAGLTRRHGLAGLINLDPVPGGRAPGSLAWAGLANCYYWADPAEGVAGVLFSQVFPFGDPGVLATFEAVERATYDGRAA